MLDLTDSDLQDQSPADYPSNVQELQLDATVIVCFNMMGSLEPAVLHRCIRQCYNLLAFVILHDCQPLVASTFTIKAPWQVSNITNKRTN